jgi:hypothetical protein
MAAPPSSFHVDHWPDCAAPLLAFLRPRASPSPHSYEPLQDLFEFFGRVQRCSSRSQRQAPSHPLRQQVSHALA